jgi:hypothetical protein
MSAVHGTQPTPPKRPDILVRCGLITPAGKVAGAETQPDADLLSLIERYEALLERRHRLWIQAREYDQNGRRHKQLSDEAFKYRDEIERLEIKISETPAKSVIGAAAKVSAAMYLIDPMGEGISKNGTQHRLSLAALVDAKAMLGAE